MARAVCTCCGAHVWWTASRGSRLRDLRSPCCGAQMRGPGRGAAETVRICVVCHLEGKRGLSYPASGYEGFCLLVGTSGLCRPHRSAPPDLVREAIHAAWWLAPHHDAAWAAYSRYLALEEGVSA